MKRCVLPMMMAMNIIILKKPRSTPLQRIRQNTPTLARSDIPGLWVSETSVPCDSDIYLLTSASPGNVYRHSGTCVKTAFDSNL